ncbi:OprD family porin [Entomomonas sp. E2T0]|uniref:OprD family porin n=1 Tax=Entomomonas sp. E2T0 TaxID=2930213 RepID=UPI0022281C6E|nr:OprD family porin [Entomomonas sp. E2T0]UYZ82550.1 OprD family porin [Entomomonas sp. E2T0]
MKKLLILTTACTTTFYLPLNAMAEEHGFLEDSTLTITAKNYYYDNNNRDNYAGQAREWGQGFILDYKSGFTQGTVGVGIDALAMFGFRLDSGGRSGKANIDRTPGTMFPLKRNGKAEDSFGSFGVAPKIRISKTEAKYGTFIPNMPVAVGNNGRLLPQTFDGGMITSNEFEDFTFVGGKLEHVKGRASTDNQSMSVDGASTGIASNKFYFGGVDYRVTKDLKLQYYYGNLKEFYKQHFLGLNYGLALPVGNLTTDVRYFYSDSDGKNASSSGRGEGYRIKGYNNNGEVDNQTWSLALTYTVKGHALTGGYQSLSGNSNFPFLNQGTAWSGAGGSTAYLWTDSQIGKFLSAGQRTWFGQYSFNFADVGVPGLTASIKYLKGSHVYDTRAGANYGKKEREWERDFKVAYKIQSGPLKDLELAWMNATFRSGASNDLDENRLIATYTFVFDKF